MTKLMVLVYIQWGVIYYIQGETVTNITIDYQDVYKDFE